MTFLLETIRLGLANLSRHKLRSVLTALGIILGVAAVIAMVSIGEGAKRRALEQLERLGARNIILRSQRPPETQNPSGGQRTSFVSRHGLERLDVRLLQESIPNAEAIVPLKEVGGQVIKDELRRTSQAYGTTPEMLRVANLRIDRGRYLSEADLDQREPVAVIGAELAKVMFPFDDPIDQTIRIDAKPMRIIGVLAPVGLSGGAGAALVGRDLNFDLHIPITTAVEVFGDMVMRRTSGSFQGQAVQVSEVYIVAPERDQVMTYAALAQRVIETRHPGMIDVSMVVPYELLENAKKTAVTYGAILSAIAAISLLVGGIGIMNIMLASVTERTREIGIRRALGATRKHIVWQFLVETGVLSSAGGLIGVGLGIATSLLLGWGVALLPHAPLIGHFVPSDADLPTSITLWSILLAFLVAAATGLIFGIYPALQAARQDPIVALRHD
ncbi:MAG: ABC transporter permease [Phycisphaerae bacterium]|nr:ABC transporter permease [Phycisphaerae bacterium]